METKSKTRSGKEDSAPNSSVENAKEESPHPSKERNKSRLRRRRERASEVEAGSHDSADDPSNQSKRPQKRRRKKKKKGKSSRGTTATETSSEWTAGDRRSGSRLPSRERKREDKPKELSEKDLVHWMQKIVPYVSIGSPLWNTWTLAPLYHFIRNPNAMVCIAFLLDKYEADDVDDATSSKGVLHRLAKVCKGNLITINQLISEYHGEFFYFLKMEPVTVDGLNYDEVVIFGNVPSGDPQLIVNNILVNHWTQILMNDECLPMGIRNDVFTELNTVSCAVQTATYFCSKESHQELLLYIPPEVSRDNGENKSDDFKLAEDKEFCGRLEETIVYWITKLKQVLILHDELNDTDAWHGPLEEIQFWTYRAKNLKNILVQIPTPQMRHVLRILAVSHSPYLSELKLIFEDVSACHQEASSNARYLEILRQPLETMPSCKLRDIRVEMQKVLWLTLTIWRNAPYYNTPRRLNGLLRKFSNALIMICKCRIHVKRIFGGVDIPKNQRILKNCLKCLEWWKEIYSLTEVTHKSKVGEKPWIFEEGQIFVYVDALILRIRNLQEICEVQTLYKIKSLPLYPGIKGPYISGVMKICDRILTSKLEELKGISELVMNVKNTEWSEYMQGFRDTMLATDMSVQNVLELSFEQMPNLIRKVELMQLFQRFYEKREVVTRQLDKLCVKLYEHFEQEVLILKKLFERKVVPLPETYTKMAGRGTWAIFMKNRIESDLETLKNAEPWLPKTSGVGFRNLVKNEAKCLAEAMGAFSEKCYKNWAKDFQHAESHMCRENHRGKLEVPLLIRGKGELVKVNFDRSVYMNLSEAEMWVRLGRSVPPVLLFTIYPWRDKLHELKENVWVVAKLYNKCIGGLSRDERLLFKDRLLPVEKKICPCLVQRKFTWTSVKTADQQFLEEFRELTEIVLENVKEYREATSKVADIIAKVCDRRLVKVGCGKDRGKDVKVYDSVEEFMMKQNERIEKELRKIVKGYRAICAILKELFVNLFRMDGVEVKVQWGKYVDLVDSCVEEALKWCVKKSLEILEDVVGNEEGERAFFRVKMVLEGSELKFSPGLEEMAGMVTGIHRNMAKTVEPLVRLGRFLGTGKLAISWEKGGMTGYCDTLLCDEASLEIQKRVILAVQRVLSEVNLYSERWIPYRDIWEVDRGEFMKNYEKQYPNLEAYDKDLKRYKEISEIVDGGDSMVTIRWLQVDCTKLKEEIAFESTEWHRLLAGNLYGRAKKDLTTVYGYIEGNRKVLSKQPETLQEQMEMWKVAQNVRGEVKQKIFSMFPDIKEKFSLLRKYNFEFEPEVEEMEVNLESSWRKYMRFLRETDERLEKSRGQMKEAFLEQAGILKEKVGQLQKTWELEGPFSKRNGSLSSDGALMLLENFRNEVKGLQQEDEKLINTLETFNLRRNRNKVLMELECDITGLSQVWKQIQLWEDNWSTYKNIKISSLDVGPINQLAEKFLEIFHKLHEEFEIKSWPVIDEVNEFIGNVQASSKCSLLLRQKTLQPRHWEWIKSLLSKDNSLKVGVLPSSPGGLDLQKIIQLELHHSFHSISELSWSSEKEMAVEQTLNKIQEFWENETFNLKKHKMFAGTQVPFELQCNPELQDNLMDHIVSLTAMKGSRFLGTLQENIDFWEKSLQNVSDSLGELLETQMEWMLLDRVFSKEHIQRDMPGTSKNFNVVSSVWASILVIVTEIRIVVRVMNETENLQEMLQDLQGKMDDIRKELAVYLQNVRQEFPRFYFIPNDKLLDVIGGGENETVDTLEVMQKMFGNFGGVNFSEQEEEIRGKLLINGIVSADGYEELELGRPVKMWDGPVEAWLTDVEKEIQWSVKDNLAACLVGLGGNWSKVEEYVVGKNPWTGQSLLNTLRIQWTADVSQAIQGETVMDDVLQLESRSGGNSLKKVVKRLRRSVEKLAWNLRKIERESSQIKTLEAVIVTLGYLRDVTERLHARNCSDLNSFEWLQYFRWHWSPENDEKLFVVKQGFAAIPYGWEFCNGRSASLMTPLTERCFLALTTAIGFQMGGIIHGACNSGKRETINELGHQLGKLVMNVRMNVSTEYGSVSSFVTGLVQTGAWGVLNGIENGTTENLQLIVSKLTLILKAKAAYHEKIMLDGIEVKLDHGCGIFAVVSIPSVGEGETADNSLLCGIKSVMRPVAMIQPDCRNILELKLFLAGFESSTGLAKKIDAIFTGAQNHFLKVKKNENASIFSLSSMLAVVKRSIELKLRHGKKLSESEAVINALEQVTLPGILEESERNMFLGLIKSYFPIEQHVGALKGENFHLEYFVRKAFQHLDYQISEKMVQSCLRLHELTQVYKSVVIVGKAGTGKSAIRRILKVALTLMHRQRGEDQLSDNDDDYCEYSDNTGDDSSSSFIKEHVINPAMMEGSLQMFGGTDPKSNKWNDGIITKIFKSHQQQFDNFNNNILLWLVFDGSLHDCWVSNEIQDMCSENAIISLANCDTVVVPMQVTIFFEVDTLTNASPGLLAKCGVMFLQTVNDENHESIWNLSLKTQLETLRYSQAKAELNKYLRTNVEKCIKFRFENCTSLILNVGALQLVEMLFVLITYFLDENKMERFGKDRYSLFIAQITAFSIVWSVFTGLDEESQQKANAFFKDLPPFQNVFPAKRTVFNYFLDIENLKWAKWENLPESVEMGIISNKNLPKKTFYPLDELISTVDISKAKYIMQCYMSLKTGDAQRPIMVYGPSNSGKSKLVSSELNANQIKTTSNLAALHIIITPQTNPRSLQSLINTRLEAISSVCLAPTSGKSLTVFIDDVNVQSKNISSCGEFLRYLMEYCMWYDLHKGIPIAISKVRFIATMETNTQSQISARMQRRFSLLYLPKPDEIQLRKIFTRMVKNKLDDFPPAVKLLADDVSIVTLEIYKLLSTKFGIQKMNSSESDHPFHIFSVNDISRVYKGLFRAVKESQNTKLGILRLWYHECTRVFHDRLTEQEPRLACLDILEKQLSKHFEISPQTLFASRSNGIIDDVPPIFGNFMKGDKCYKEIKNVTGVYKLIEEKIQGVINGRKPVAMSKEGVSQVAKISRVISQEKGHMIICGDEGQGRETSVRAAAALYQYKIFQMPSGTRSQNCNKLFLDVLKNTYLTCVEESVGCCLILKDEQITEKNLDLIFIATSTVEIPDLISKKEILEIFKLCKTKKLMRDGDGDAPVDVMTWFKKTVEKNLHIVLCVKPTDKKFFAHVQQNFSGLLKTMTVNWFDIWSQASYKEVACNLLKMEVYFKTYSKKSSSLISQYEIFYSIHSLANRESSAVTLMHYLDFIELYKWYLKNATEQYSKQMKTLRNAIQEIVDVRSKIGALTEQAESAERKAAAARLECEKMFAIIKTQESDVNVQESIVNEMIGRLEEEIKEYEALALLIKNEWTEALGDFEKSTEIVQDLAEEDLTHIRSYFSPPPLVSRVLDAVMIMLDREQSWPEAKIQLGHPRFIKSILEYDKAQISLEKLNNLRKFIQNKEFTPEAVSKYSNGARILCAWIHAIEKYGRCYLSRISPKREKLEHSEVSILENKHALLLASEKLQLLQENVTEITSIYASKLNFKGSLEHDAKQCCDVLGRAASVLKLLEQENNGQHNNHVQKWKENLVQFERKMDKLGGNALLCSAYLAYAGLFSGDVRRKLKERWRQEIEMWMGTTEIKEEWRLEDALDFENVGVREQLEIYLKGFYSQKYQDSHESEWLVENILLVKLSRRPVLCLDPHQMHMKNGRNGNRTETVEGKSVENKLMEIYSSLVFNDEEKVIFVSKSLSHAEIDKKISSRFSVVHFGLRSQGLITYFALQITRMIFPEEESKRQTLVQNALAEKIRIEDFADKIPKLVISCGGESILNNGQFPETLSEWQDAVQQSKRNLEEMETEIEKIESTRHRYNVAATGFTRLFETINEMSSISKLFEISLEFFTGLIKRLFHTKFSQKKESSSTEEESPRKDLVEQMIEFLEEEVTLKVFQITARFMPKLCRYQFLLLLCIKTLLDETKQPIKREMLKEELSLLLSATVSDNADNHRNQHSEKTLDWLTDHQMDGLERLDKLKGFKGLRESIRTSESTLWRDWTTQNSSDFPGDWDSKLTALQKLLLVSILRPNFLPNQIVLLTKQVLGKHYSECLASSELLDVKEIYNATVLESGSSSTPIFIIPIIFLMDANAKGLPDPEQSVRALANSLTLPQNLYALPVTKRNTELAHKLIEESGRKGFWVYLSHCHINEDWFWELETVLKKRSYSFQKNFKLWMSGKLDESDFPKEIIRNSIRVAMESPPTLQRSMERLQKKMADSSVDQISSEKFRDLLNRLCYFHCKLQGKTFQGNLEFPERFPVLQDTDFEVSLSILKLFALKYWSEDEQLASYQFPWWALKQMLELQYINHFSDETFHQRVRDQIHKIFSADFPSMKDPFEERILTDSESGFDQDFLEIYELPQNLADSVSMRHAIDVLNEAYTFQRILKSIIDRG